MFARACLHWRMSSVQNANVFIYFFDRLPFKRRSFRWRRANYRSVCVDRFRDAGFIGACHHVISRPLTRTRLCNIVELRIRHCLFGRNKNGFFGDRGGRGGKFRPFFHEIIRKKTNCLHSDATTRTNRPIKTRNKCARGQNRTLSYRFVRVYVFLLWKINRA